MCQYTELCRLGHQGQGLTQTLRTCCSKCAETWIFLSPLCIFHLFQFTACYVKIVKNGKTVSPGHSI